MNKHTTELIKTSFSKIFPNFGINQAKAYSTLLEKESMTAFEISKKSGVPRGRIYDTLTELKRKNLIKSQESHPKQFFIINTNETIEKAFQTKIQEIENTKQELLNQLTQIQQNAKHEVKDIFKLIKVESIDQIQDYTLNLIKRTKKNELILLAGGKCSKYYSNPKSLSIFLNALARGNTIKVMAKINPLLPELSKNFIKLKRTNEFLTYLNKETVQFKDNDLPLEFFLRSKKEVIIGIRNLDSFFKINFLIHVMGSSGKTCKLAEKLEDNFFKVWKNKTPANLSNFFKIN